MRRTGQPKISGHPAIKSTVASSHRCHAAGVAHTEFVVEGGGISVEALAQALADGMNPRVVVLVEGTSDREVLLALAELRGRDLDAEGVEIVPMGGATKVQAFLDVLGPKGHDVRLAGLCDAPEEGHFRRGLERAGLGTNLARSDLEQLGFYVCVIDLEDELFRSLGTSAVEEVIAAQGQLRSFRSLQNQPAMRGAAHLDQLRRFIKGRSGYAKTYGRLLVEALDLGRVPRPLDGVLDHTTRSP